MLTEQRIILNLIPNEVPPIAHVTQGDVGRVIWLTLIDGHKPFDISSEYNFKIQGVKPSNESFVFDEDFILIDKMTIAFKTTAEMTSEAGSVYCGLIISDGEEAHIETLSFILQVQDTAYSGTGS